MTNELQRLKPFRKITSLFLALAFVLNVFAIIPSAESHEQGEHASHYMVSTADDLPNSHEIDRHNHMEKCGMATCAIDLPLHFIVTKVAFGTKTPFDIRTTQVTSRHLTPPDRPPNI